MPFFSSPSFLPSLLPSFLSPRLGDLIDHSSNPNVVIRSCASMGKIKWAFLVAQLVKNQPAMWETWVGKIPRRRERLPTSVFWPGDFHGWRD